MNKLRRDLPHHRRQHVRRGQVVHRLSERDENKSDRELVVRQVFDDVRVETEDAQLVRAHHSTEELHDQHFVLESVHFVCAEERAVPLEGGIFVWGRERKKKKKRTMLAHSFVKLLTETLRVVQQLKSGEVGGDPRVRRILSSLLTLDLDGTSESFVSRLGLFVDNRSVLKFSKIRSL